MNGNGFEFNQDFEITSFTGFRGAGPGYFGGGIMEKVVTGSAYQLNDGGTNSSSQGNPPDPEPHGTIRFNKAFSKLAWKSQSDEIWNGFTVGITGTSDDAGALRFNKGVGSNQALGDVVVNSQVVTANSATVNAESLDVNGRSTLGASVTTT